MTCATKIRPAQGAAALEQRSSWCPEQRREELSCVEEVGRVQGSDWKQELGKHKVEKWHYRLRKKA